MTLSYILSINTVLNWVKSKYLINLINVDGFIMHW